MPTAAASTAPSHRLKYTEASSRPSSTIVFVFTLALGLVALSFFFSSTALQHRPLHVHNSLNPIKKQCLSNPDRSSECNFAEGKWILDDTREPLYGEKCIFQRNAWNCEKNRRPGLETIYKWSWVPANCSLPPLDPFAFLSAMKNMNLGFVGDSLNENMLVSLLCILSTADPGAQRWKKKKAWRGGYFPKYNVTIGYHRAVLLADYHEWKATNPLGKLEKLGFKKGYQVNVDLPAADWINATSFYDIIIFNTGHWWNFDKFPADNPLLFHKQGEPVIPPLDMMDGLELVLQHMIPYIERVIPPKVMKIWRLQSPRHFEGGDWNQNGSCLSNQLLDANQIEEWFGIGSGGVNKEARELNTIIMRSLQSKNFRVLNVSHLSEFRQDAHPAIWLGQKNAHIIWGQDCMHWCLPGLPDIWNNILLGMIYDHIDSKKSCLFDQ